MKGNMKCTGILLLFVFIGMKLFAQHGDSKTDSTRQVTSLGEVVVSANRFPEQKRKIAQQVLVIDKQKIELLNQPTTAEMLTQSGNVLVQKSQLGGGSPIIRGFEANKILIVVDGVRLNNAIYRGGHLQNVITIDPSILERTEILFGPSSVMYGSDALGGVMSFTTKTPLLTNDSKHYFQSNAFMRYASAYQEKTGHADVSFGNQHIASFTSISVSDFGDLRQGSHYFNDFPGWGKRNFYVQRINGKDSMMLNTNPDKQKGSGYSQYDLMQKIVFKTGHVLHELNLQYSQSSDINRYDRLTEINAAGKAKSAEWYYGPAKRLLAVWTIRLPKSYWYDKANLSLHLQDITESRHNRNFNSTKLNHRNEHVGVYGMNADFKKLYGKGDIRYGAEVVFNTVRSTASAENIENGTTSALDTRYPDGGSHTSSIAIYAGNTHAISEKLFINDGIRFTQQRLTARFNDKTFFPFPFNDIRQSSFNATGNIGINYLPAKGWKISALLSSGFRTPNVDDLSKVFESGNGILIVPNPNLKPERTWNYELGVSKTVDKKYHVGATVWYCDYRNVLTTGAGTLNGASTVDFDGTASKVITVINKNKAYLVGSSGQMDVSITPNIGFSGTLHYTYGRTREEGKKFPLDHIAPLFGKAAVHTQVKGFTAELFVLFNGKKDSSSYKLLAEDNELYSADPVRGYTPGWTTINIRSSYNATRHLTIQFSVENITDKYYRVFASGLSAPGRNFTLTLRAKL